ncbi:hypothetical protein B0H11DRAFT_2213820 [Mycena galericulata]|nr:hypothetical protein B0H11DRAFT_2213820 [Mycena galericulata]
MSRPSSPALSRRSIHLAVDLIRGFSRIHIPRNPASVDLHTHATFQWMLPESFAMVYTPESEPSFGIFRPARAPDSAKQAFHLHLDVPIYTDAEIVDLR